MKHQDPLTSRERAIWQHGFISGKEDFGGIVIAAMVEKGQTIIGINELRDIVYFFHDELPREYIGEHVLELLDRLHEIAR